MKKTLACLAALLAFVPLGFGSTQLHPGSLDPNFGQGGRVVTQVGEASGEDYTYANAVAIQRDGRIIAAGAAFTKQKPPPPQGAFGLARYRPGGSLDRSFGKHGKVTTPLPTSIPEECCAEWPHVNVLAIQRDGKVLAGGFSSGATLVRYTRRGDLDRGFGTGGKVTAAVGPVYGMALQPDGKIVVAGLGFTVARYNADGSLDHSFGSGGVVTTSLGGPQQGADAVAVQRDGKIVVAGWREAPDYSDNETALARFNPDGSLDTSFGNGGKVINAADYRGAEPWPRTILLRPDGKIVFVGYYTAQYRPDGSLDTTFGTGGVANRVIGASAVLQRDGKIVTVPCGQCGDGWKLRRYKVDGSPDPSFAAAPWRKFYPRAVGLQPDGKIVATGSVDDKFAQARYLSGKERCIVPEVVGKRLAKAKHAIRSAYCSVGRITRAFSSRVAKGRVISQRPKARKRRPFGAKVKLVLSKGASAASRTHP